MVEDTVDLAFHEDASDFVGWTVVDFKTHREVWRIIASERTSTLTLASMKSGAVCWS
jgi:hypothetical protein